MQYYPETENIKSIHNRVFMAKTLPAASDKMFKPESNDLT